MKLDFWKKYSFEFLSIFLAVISAFALNNWNDNRRDHNAEVKILKEISNGLEKDIEDINENVFGHKEGIESCVFWRKIINNQPVKLDSLIQHYQNLTRDYISIQNRSGYESLKSKGLEIIEDDSLRSDIISLYEYDFTTLRKLEEEYREIQFHQSYFKDINEFIAPNLAFDERGNIASLKIPLQLTERDKKIFLSYLWKIQINRNFTLHYYNQVEQETVRISQWIQTVLAK